MLLENMINTVKLLCWKKQLAAKDSIDLARSLAILSAQNSKYSIRIGLVSSG